MYATPLETQCHVILHGSQSVWVGGVMKSICGSQLPTQKNSVGSSQRERLIESHTLTYAPITGGRW